jgi:hypothetical protein
MADAQVAKINHNLSYHQLSSSSSSQQGENNDDKDDPSGGTATITTTSMIASLPVKVQESASRRLQEDWHQLSTMAITIQSTLATWYEITSADYDQAVKFFQLALSIAKKQRKRSPTYQPPPSQQQVYKNNATTTCRQAIRDPYCRIKRTRDVPWNLCCWCHPAVRNNRSKH